MTLPKDGLKSIPAFRGRFVGILSHVHACYPGKQDGAIMKVFIWQ